VISRDTKNKDEAALFLRFAASDEGAAIWEANAPGYMMWTRKSLVDKNPDFKKMPMSLIFDELFQWGQPRPLTAGFTEYNEVVVRGTKDIIQSGLPVKDTVAQMVIDIDKALARYK